MIATQIAQDLEAEFEQFREIEADLDECGPDSTTPLLCSAMRLTCRMIVTFMLLAISSASAYAASGVFQLPPVEFTRLDLTDGRKLKNVVVKSYDDTTDRFFIMADGNAIVIPAKLLPGNLAREIRSKVEQRPSAPSANTSSTARRVITAAEQYSLEQPSRTRAPTRPAAPTPVRVEIPTRLTPPTPVNSAGTGLPTAQDIDAHKSVALAHAERFYRYEFRAGSDNIKVTALDFDMNDPKPIQGWKGRFRTEGKAFLEFYDSKGGSFQRSTSTFEVITQRTPGARRPQVESFSRKS